MEDNFYAHDILFISIFSFSNLGEISLRNEVVIMSHYTYPFFLSKFSFHRENSPIQLILQIYMLEVR